ncbi:hypothetical protein [Limnoglobus roseus]|uniref:Uncharacterized protein n=1 Tax=Limnoglobus roseus TaxID=2598579 RepID=A0A5C1AGA0_9BACT|nr:hypothetical protein [Limnoglobus roseus]QEL17850.1 hypothetical protein PX52LOC_04861 [Limnoglobus roseus]
MNTANFITMTALGSVYGINAQDVGRKLKALGLRTDDGRPSHRALDEGFVQEKLLEFGGSHWLWNEQKACGVLDGAGNRRGGDKGEEIVDGCILIRGG